MVARMARGLDMRVLAYDPCAASIACADVAFCTLEELVRETDAVSLHCSAEPGARPLVDAAFLQKMKPGALLVNTARAGLVDAAAVRAALDSCRLARSRPATTRSSSTAGSSPRRTSAASRPRA